MNKQELRLNNYVLVNYIGENFEEKQGVTRVIGLHQEGSLGDGWSIEVEALEPDFDECEVLPIPLTEDVLLNFKGVKEKQGSLGKYYYFEPYLLLRFYFQDGKLVAVKQEGNKSIWLKDIEFVHTFQNFFYALTNQELNIEL